jgi:sulfite exporter TauE/SafE
MDKLTEQQPENTRHSLLYWVLRIAVGVNLIWYGLEFVINLTDKLLTSSEPITWQRIILGTSYNWDSFWRVRIFGLVFGIICSVAGWGLELYWQRKKGEN